MSGFSIALSGFQAAQKAIDVIGNNIANTATEGYHRQRIDFVPAYASQNGAVMIGGGVESSGITRMINEMLEKQIISEQSLLGQAEQEYRTLSSIEDALGEFTAGGGSLSVIVDEFFDSLKQLSENPDGSIWQNQALSSADAMASRFRLLGDFLSRLQSQIQLEAENTVEEINSLLTQVGRLNSQIRNMEIAGTDANNLMDERDQCITELSELASLETIARDCGVTNVLIAGLPVVVNTAVSQLELRFDVNGDVGVNLVGSDSYAVQLQSGKLGGLLSLKNDLVADIQSDLDELATTLIQQINQRHVQGVGSAGSFTSLTGWIMSSETLADFDPSVSDGSIYIRVTNTSTGQITRSEISVDASTDTLGTIATAISGITGLSASVANSRLSIQADTNYKFDFLPVVLPEAAYINFNGSSDPAVSVSGIYTGSANDTLTFEVSGTGDVGVDTLTLTVKDGALNVIDTINIGSGYAAGDEIEVGDTGIKISLTTGDFVNGDSFGIDVFGNTDTSGVLAAVGINTFFSGSNASTIAVCSDIENSPSRIATALGADMTDNTNVMKMVDLSQQSFSDLNSLTPGEFYRQMVTNVGQELYIRHMDKDNTEAIMQNLLNQRSEASGVDINEQAAQLLMFEQMFQAMAKYMETVHSSLAAIMEIM